MITELLAKNRGKRSLRVTHGDNLDISDGSAIASFIIFYYILIYYEPS